MDLLNKTLIEMREVFSSNEFSYRAKKNGLSVREVAAGVCGHFLHRNAIQLDTRRKWKKKNMEENLHVINRLAVPAPEFDIKDEVSGAINLLKNLGYKILKPQTKWDEV